MKLFEDGIVLLDKEVGITSNDLNYKVRNIFETKKTGHLGTLDPFASGLMIIGVNEGTKLLPYLKSDIKSYDLTLKLGSETDTLDNTGEVIKKCDVILEDEDKIKSIIKSFVKTYDQIPPKYSAKCVNGVRAYTLARENVEFELKSKRITVFSIDNIVIDKENNFISFSCDVSEGTYIRSLGRDIAYALNTLGHLVSLRRTRVGEFVLDSTVKTYKNLQREDLVRIDKLLPSYNKYYLNKEEFELFRYGREVSFKYIGDRVILFFGEACLFLSEYDKYRKTYKVLRGLNYEHFKVKKS